METATAFPTLPVRTLKFSLEWKFELKFNYTSPIYVHIDSSIVSLAISCILRHIQMAEAQLQDEHRRLFYEWLNSLDCTNSILITEKKKQEFIEVLSDEKSTHKYKYKYRARYGFMQIGNLKQLYIKKNEARFMTDGVVCLEKFQRVVTSEELFDVLKTTHVELLHGKRLKMQNRIDEKFGNISRLIIDKFLQLCPICTEAMPRLSKREGLKPIITFGFNT